MFTLYTEVRQIKRNLKAIKYKAIYEEHTYIINALIEVFLISFHVILILSNTTNGILYIVSLNCVHVWINGTWINWSGTHVVVSVSHSNVRIKRRLAVFIQVVVRDPCIRGKCNSNLVTADVSKSGESIVRKREHGCTVVVHLCHLVLIKQTVSYLQIIQL